MNAQVADFPARLRRLETLVQQAERLHDPAAREAARELVRALLDLHAAGLERLLGHVAAGVGSEAIMGACAADDVVSGLLLLHGLHPLGLEERVRQAVESLRPHLRGGGLELLGVDEGVVRLRLTGGCGGGSSAAALRQVVEEAVFGLAPEAAGVEIEGLDTASYPNGRIALNVL